MATHDVNGPTTSAEARFCVDCGAVLAGGRFCPSCGNPATPFPRNEAASERAANFVDGVAETTVVRDAQPVNGRIPDLDDVEAVTQVQPPVHGHPQPQPKGRRQWPIFAVCALLLVAAAGVVAAVLLTGGSSSDKPAGQATSVYQQKAAAAFSPVDAANRRLSNRLSALSNGHAGPAKAAVAQAQSATSTARGALGALTVPAESRNLDEQLRQALDREDTYLSAVRLALADPSSPSVSQVQSLAGNLTSALEAVGAPISGAARHVNGADNLTAWAGRTRRAAARQHAQQNQANGASTGPGSTGTPAAASGGTDCGDGLHAGPNTSCDFARNVQSAWAEAPGETATVDVYSPVTGQTYTMDCSPAGDGITCSGGNNASVSW